MAKELGSGAKKMLVFLLMEWIDENQEDVIKSFEKDVEEIQDIIAPASDNADNDTGELQIQT